MDTALAHSDRSPCYLIYQVHFPAEDGVLQDAERLQVASAIRRTYWRKSAILGEPWSGDLAVGHRL